VTFSKEDTAILDHLAAQEVAFDSLMQERDYAVSYHEITERMGPSPQLIAFITKGVAVQTDDGIGLESLSLNQQHMLLASKLDVAALDQMGLENLADRVRKISKYVVKGGVVAWFAGFLVGGVIGPLGLAAAIAGGITMKVAGTATETYKRDTFFNLRKKFEEVMAKEVAIANAFPTTYTVPAWKTFSAKYKSNPLTSVYVELTKVPFDRSGWNEQNFSEAVKWLKENGQKLAALQKTFGGRTDALYKWLSVDHGPETENGPILKYISETVGMSVKLFYQSTAMLNEIESVLSAVAHRFEESKKD
jgi:hypothetical protein